MKVQIVRAPYHTHSASPSILCYASSRYMLRVKSVLTAELERIFYKDSKKVKWINNKRLLLKLFICIDLFGIARFPCE